MKKIQTTFLLMALLVLFNSCKKFLDEKQDSRFTIPQTLNDLQLLLDNYTVMNTGYPYQAEVSADNYYLISADYNGLTDANLRSFHIWEKTDQRVQDWYNMYRIILHANTVLENADALALTDADKSQALKLNAAARFYRGNAMHVLAQVYAMPYSAGNNSSFGLPIKQSADVMEPVIRASVHETYQFIVNDLTVASRDMDTLKQFNNRPTKTAAFAALARCYMSMEKYAEAALYADSALQLKNELILFSSLSTSAANPFPRFNREVIFPAVSATATALAPARAKVDTGLYQSYASDDLRKTIFFKVNSNGSIAFKGDYNASNNGSTFLGYTVDELYLTKAEALARTNRVSEALDALNTLLRTRWRPNTFVNFTAANAEAAVAVINKERRKELCFRGHRWTDLRRLNQTAGTQTILTRVLNNQLYSLAPNANGYTLQIPASVIELSNIPQNP